METDGTGDVNNPNVDISAYDAKEYKEETYFYLGVEGKILYGDAIPSTRAMNIPSEGPTSSEASDHEPSQSSGTQEETPLPVETGEDAVFIFLGTQPGQGYTSSPLPLGADLMIEIKGQSGRILSARLHEFAGNLLDDWNWKFIRNVKAASEGKELEAMVDVVPLSVYFHVVAWNSEEEDYSGEMTVYGNLTAEGARYVSQGASGATLGYWRFNEASGTTAADSGGRSNSGTLKNMEDPDDWVAAKFGNGLTFDGTNGYVDLGDPSSLDVTGAITVELWTKPAGFHSSWNYLLRMKSKMEFGFHDDSGKPIFKVKNTDDTRYDVTGNALTIGKWYHIAGVRDGSSLRIYVNGVLEDSISDVTGDLAANTFVNIGGEQGSSGYNGVIDEVRILNYAKTGFGGGVVINKVGYTGDNKFIELYNNAGSSVNIRGWKFLDDDGNTLVDLSSTTYTISAGTTSTLYESTYSGLDNLDSTDSIRAYDLDPENDGSPGSASYANLVDFVAWGSSQPLQCDGSTDHAVQAGLWTEDTYISAGVADDQVQLINSGNNDEAVSDWEAIPEFSDAVAPVMSVAVLLMVFRKRKKIEGREENDKRPYR